MLQTLVIKPLLTVE